jgi:hypothetical protein
VRDDAGHQKISYEAALRMIGRVADERGIRRIRIMETITGLVLTYMQSDRAARPSLLTFSHDDIVLYSRAQRARREISDPRQETPREIGRAYENFLRALGHELDHLSACEILIDEIDDGAVFVSYQHIDPSVGFIWKKQMALMDATQRDELLSSAQARRRITEPPRGLRRLLG